MPQPKLMLDIKPLKQFALNNLPPNSVLRAILVSQNDSIDCETFLIELSMWLRLVKLESGANHK